jgi:hypothetical protein
MSLKDFAIITKLGSYIVNQDRVHTRVFIKYKDILMGKYML